MRLFTKSPFVKSIFFLISLASVTPLLFLSSAQAYASGTTCTWTGLGGDLNFSTAANWSGCGGAPQDGDSIELPNNTSNPSYETLNDDIPNLTITAITQGQYFYYTISGDALTVTQQLVNMQALNTITLGGTVTILGSNLTDVNLNGHTLIATGNYRTGNLVSGITGQGNITVANGAEISDFNALNGNWSGTLTIGPNASILTQPNPNQNDLGSNTNTIVIDTGGTSNVAGPGKWNETIPQHLILGANTSSVTPIVFYSYDQGGSLTVTGPITLTANTALAGDGAITITGPISGNYTIRYGSASGYPGGGSLTICSSDNRSRTPNAPSCSNHFPIRLPIFTNPIYQLHGFIIDANENLARNDSLTVSCNKQTAQTTTNNTGQFRITFPNTCPLGSNVTFTSTLGVPYKPGTQEKGTGTVYFNGYVGAIRLIAPPSQRLTYTNIERAAVRWALSMLYNKAGKVGGEYWFGCLAFVVHAYEQGASYQIRKDISVVMGSKSYPDDVWGHLKPGIIDTNPKDIPPPGALVFWYSTGGIPGNTDYQPDSHVAISIGNGLLVSTNVDQKNVPGYNNIHLESMKQFNTLHTNIYKGWWLPDQQ